VLVENGFWHEIATRGPSTPFILQSVTNRQGQHIVMQDCWLYIWSFQRSSHSNRQKIAVIDNPTLIWRPRQEEPPRISACNLYLQKLQSLAHIFVLIVWDYRHSTVCSGLQNTLLLCNRVRFFRSMSSKVDDFDTNRKRVCDFLLVDHCGYGAILHRYSEIRRLIG